MIVHIETKIIEPQPRIEVQPALQKIDPLLQIAGYVRDVGIGTGGYVEYLPFLIMEQVHVDLVVVKVRSGGKQRAVTEQFVGMEILHVDALLQARIVLLDLVAVYRILEKKSEIRVEIE